MDIRTGAVVNSEQSVSNVAFIFQALPSIQLAQRIQQEGILILLR
jgi:hypothetical protein